MQLFGDLKSDLAKLLSEQASKRSKIESESNELQSINENMKILLQEFHREMEVLSSHMTDHSHITKKNSQLAFDYHTATASFGILKKQFDAISEKSEALNQSQREYALKYNAKIKGQDAISAEVSATCSYINEKITLYQSLTKEMNGLNEEILKIETKIEAMHTERKDKDELASGLEIDLSMLESSLKQLEIIYCQKQEQIKALTQAQESWKIQLSQVEADQNAMTIRIGELTEERACLSQEHESKVQELRQKHELVQIEYEKEKHENDAKVAKLKEINEKITTILQQYDSIKKDELIKQKEEMQSFINAGLVRKAENEEKIKKTDEELKQFALEISKSQRDVEALSQQKQKQGEKDSVTNELLEWKSKQEQLERELSKSSELLASYDRIQNECLTYFSLVEAFHKEHVEKLQQKKKQDSQIKSIKTKRNQWQQKYNDLLHMRDYNETLLTQQKNLLESSSLERDNERKKLEDIYHSIVSTIASF